MAYLVWWYAQEPAYIWKAITVITSKVFHSFSVVLLLRTLFDPWKRDVTTQENASLDVVFKLWLNNLISRFVGFIIRLVTIIVGLILTVVVFLVLLTGFACWLFMPVIIVLLFINGVRTILYE